MGFSLLKVFQDSMIVTSSSTSLLLVSAILFYGIRLASFLLVRELTVPSKKKQLDAINKTPTLKRIPFAMSVSLFYAFMVTPALYLCRSSSSSAALTGKALVISKVGTALAWFGAVTEAITDTQKFLAKKGKDGSSEFVGPTSGGAPTLQNNIAAWIMSLLGMSGIYSIMSNATKRLDGRQVENYGGQEKYEEWITSGVPLLVPTNLIRSIVPVLLSVGLAATLIKIVQLLAV
eukprot:7733046-Ditylum_brightwellii.AAC.1